MSLPNELNSFLLKQKESFLLELNSNSKTLSNWVITIGNEAGDLDSLACAIASAYLLSQNTASSTTQFIPLIQTASTDLYLRPENLLALESAGISPSSLLYLSDIPEEKLNLSKEFNVGWFLVDLNKLQDVYGGKEARVVGILDHHADENLYPEASPRVIKPFIVGSCSSLVTNHFHSLKVGFPPNLIDLLLSALLIDTGLKSLEEGGKGGEEDSKAAQFLLSASGLAPLSITSTTSLTPPTSGPLLSKSEALNKAKFDVTNMSGRDLLRRDYKEYNDSGLIYGLSTVPVGFEAWLEKVRKVQQGGKEVEVGGWKAIEMDLEGWSKERNLGLLGVLTSFTTPSKELGGKMKHQREVLLYLSPSSTSPSVTRLEPIFHSISQDETLNLKEWKGTSKGLGVGKGEGWRLWSQGNGKATRKQIAPILKGLVGKVLSGGKF